jgi:hypothetical protein
MLKEAAFSVSDGRKGMTDEEMEEMKRGNGETRGRGDDGKAGAIQCDRPFDLRKDIETGKRGNERTGRREDDGGMTEK